MTITEVEGSTDNAAETQRFKEPSQILLLHFDHTVLKAIDPDARVGFLHYFLERNTESVP